MPTRSGLLTLLIAAPAVVGALALGVIEAVQMRGSPSGAPAMRTLADAIAEGEVEQAYMFIRTGQDPNTPFTFRHPELTAGREVTVSPMLLAVAAHRDGVVGMLLSTGARLDLPQNRSAMCLAKQLGDSHMVELLAHLGGASADASCPSPKPDAVAPLLGFVD